MRLGKSVAMNETTDADDQVGSQAAAEKSPDLSAHQTFRLTRREKARLYQHAQDEKVSVSTFLRRLLNEVTDGNE
jgi:hypothetical protein